MEQIKQAKELADQILEQTQALVLTGAKELEEQESEAYAMLMDEREPLIDELTDLRYQISETEAASTEFEEIKKVIAQITDLDKKHIKVIEHMRKNAQASYKEVKQGQRIHAGYNPLPGNEISRKFNVTH